MMTDRPHNINIAHTSTSQTCTAPVCTAWGRWVGLLFYVALFPIINGPDGLRPLPEGRDIDRWWTVQMDDPLATRRGWNGRPSEGGGWKGWTAEERGFTQRPAENPGWSGRALEEQSWERQRSEQRRWNKQAIERLKWRQRLLEGRGRNWRHYDHRPY